MTPQDRQSRTFERLQAIHNARQTIELARVRCLSFADLIERLRDGVFRDDQCSTEVYAIIERAKGGSENAALAAVLDDLLEHDKLVPVRRRAQLDRQVGRMLETLPPDIAKPLVLKCLGHSRKSRRTAGFRAIPRIKLDPEDVRFLNTRFNTTHDEGFIRAIVKAGVPVAARDADGLINILGLDNYWSMRVIETALRSDRNAASDLAQKYPAQFIHAAGRIGDASLADLISRCFDAANDKAALVGIVAWAYGKLGAMDKLNALSTTLDSIESSIRGA